jgi:hypothetical protein
MNLAHYPGMVEYVNQVMNVTQKLAAIGYEVDDEFIGVIMLNGLTPDYDPMVMALDSSGQEISSQFTKSKLLSEAHRRYGTQQEAALAVKASNHRAAPTHKMKYRCKCNKCRKWRHKKVDCPEVSNSEDNKSNKSSASKKGEVRTLLTALGMSTGMDTADWLVDSGATSHMIMRRDWIQDFKESPMMDATTASCDKIPAPGVGDIAVSTTFGVKTIVDV